MKKVIISLVVYVCLIRHTNNLPLRFANHPLSMDGGDQNNITRLHHVLKKTLSA